jgi:hypothetical protein
MASDPSRAKRGRTLAFVFSACLSLVVLGVLTVTYGSSMPIGFAPLAVVILVLLGVELLVIRRA